MSFNDRFERFATTCARWTGHSLSFTIAVLVTLLWAVTGPLFRFGNAWQLIINTATTVLTFLMVFILQNTMNRDSKALHLKLDELIRVTREAHNTLIGAEGRTGSDLDRLDSELVAKTRATDGQE